MTLELLIQMLEQTGIPLAYDHFPLDDAPDPPYMVLRLPLTDNMFADNKVYKQIVQCEIELCTKTKDPPTEKALTDVLDQNAIAWQRSGEEFIEDDGLFSIFYDFTEVFNNG